MDSSTILSIIRNKNHLLVFAERIYGTNFMQIYGRNYIKDTDHYKEIYSVRVEGRETSVYLGNFVPFHKFPMAP